MELYEGRRLNSVRRAISTKEKKREKETANYGVHRLVTARKFLALPEKREVPEGNGRATIIGAASLTAPRRFSPYVFVRSRLIREGAETGVYLICFFFP